MEKSLSTNSLIDFLSKSKAFHEAVNSCADKKVSFPADISGIKGCLGAFFIEAYLSRSELIKKSESQYEGRAWDCGEDAVIICATQKEADECESDLQTVFKDRAEIYKFLNEQLK